MFYAFTKGKYIQVEVTFLGPIYAETHLQYFTKIRLHCRLHYCDCKWISLADCSLVWQSYKVVEFNLSYSFLLVVVVIVYGTIFPGSGSDIEKQSTLKIRGDEPLDLAHHGTMPDVVRSRNRPMINQGDPTLRRNGR